MARLKALCVVAHPDDCVIFARPFMDAYPEFKWHILYLTYCHFEPRGREMADYWRRRDVTTIHLGYVDTYLDMENNLLSFNSEQAAREIVNIGQDYDLILTHNADGDYGHIHHQFVSRSASLIEQPKVYFANHLQSNLECRAITAIALDELPLHREIIQQFNELDTGRYLATETAQELLNGTIETRRNLHL
jgi:hypothetical protein